MRCDLIPMRRAKRLMWVMVVIGVCLSPSRRSSGEVPSRDSSVTGTAAVATSVHLGQDTNQSGNNGSKRAEDTTINEMKKTLDSARRHQKRLPNFVAGPGLPPPIGLNFYEMYDRYPAYLLCTYDVEENHYDQSNESAWFKAALLQIRGSGQQSFSPFKWIAVVIANRVGCEDARTLDQCYKVGAIFNASDVFDPSRDPLKLVAQAVMDKHPIVYDPKGQSPGEQHRWMIVERYAATGVTH